MLCFSHINLQDSENPVCSLDSTILETYLRQASFESQVFGVSRCFISIFSFKSAAVWQLNLGHMGSAKMCKRGFRCHCGVHVAVRRCQTRLRHGPWLPGKNWDCLRPSLAKIDTLLLIVSLVNSFCVLTLCNLSV